MRGGTLVLGNSAALQNSTVSMTGGTLTFAAGSTSAVLGGLAGTSSLALATAAAEPVVLNAGGNGQSTTYSGVLSGPGGLVKQGTGALLLTASSSYGGPTAINAGLLKLQPPATGSIGIHFIGTSSSGSFTGTGGVVPMSHWNSESGYSFSGSTLANYYGGNSGATFSLVGATSDWKTGSTNELLNGYVSSSGSNSMTLTVNGIPYSRYSMYVYVGDSSVGNREEATINGTTYYYATEGGTLATFAAVSSTSSANYQLGNYIEVDGLAGTIQTVKTAGTTQPYSGLCDVEIVSTGPTSINVLPATTSLSISSGGTLDVNGNSQQVASLSDGMSGSRGIIINSNTTASVLTISPTGGSTTFSGTIQGGGTLGTLSLLMSGSGTQVLTGALNGPGRLTINSGTLVLSGTDSYSGGTFVNGGSLIVPNHTELADGSNLTVGNSARFAAPIVSAAPAQPVPEPSTLAALSVPRASAEASSEGGDGLGPNHLTCRLN